MLLTNSKRSQLAQNDLKTWLVGVLPRTQSEFFYNKGKNQQYIIVHGAGGNYADIKTDQADLKKYAESIGAKIIQLDDLVKAHLAPEKLRKNCNIETENGISILSSSLWNSAEEIIAKNVRNLTYHSQLQGVPFQELMIAYHDKARQAIVQKLNSMANMSNADLFLNEMTIEGHKQMAPISVKQLCCDHQSLNVAPEEVRVLHT